MSDSAARSDRPRLPAPASHDRECRQGRTAALMTRTRVPDSRRARRTDAPAGFLPVHTDCMPTHGTPRAGTPTPAGRALHRSAVLRGNGQIWNEPMVRGDARTRSDQCSQSWEKLENPHRAVDAHIGPHRRPIALGQLRPCRVRYKPGHLSVDLSQRDEVIAPERAGARKEAFQVARGAALDTQTEYGVRQPRRQCFAQQATCELLVVGSGATELQPRSVRRYSRGATDGRDGTHFRCHFALNAPLIVRSASQRAPDTVIVRRLVVAHRAGVQRLCKFHARHEVVPGPQHALAQLATLPLSRFGR